MYSTDQQVFCMTMLADRSNAYNGKGATDATIAASTKKDLQTIFAAPIISDQLGNWSLVWGPQVATATVTTTKVINTLFIAMNADTRQFVVAIAGTDPSSISDWICEDFRINTLVDWTTFVPGSVNSGQVSFGTSDGLSKLLAFTDVEVDPFTQQQVSGSISASDFLKKYVPAGYTIYVGGHSLGGALSPCYALYLYETWAKAAGITVYARPVAGPTPGNDVFAAHYDSLLGGQDSNQVPLTVRVWNEQDVVPQAWVPSQMANIEQFYTNGPSCPPTVKAAVILAKNAAAPHNYTPLTGNGVSFTGINFNTNPSKDDFNQFMEELACQHVCSYPIYYNLTDFQVNVNTALGLPSTTPPYFSAGGCKVRS